MKLWLKDKVMFWILMRKTSYLPGMYQIQYVLSIDCRDTKVYCRCKHEIIAPTLGHGAANPYGQLESPLGPVSRLSHFRSAKLLPPEND